MIYEELWKAIPIDGLRKDYEVSNTGKVRYFDYNTHTYQELSIYSNSLGYKLASLCYERGSRTIGVHRLVAMAFIPNPNNYPIINHLDENPSNNRADNLEWCTYLHNNNYTCDGRVIKKPKRAVEQLTLDGEVVARYDSMAEAERKFKKNCKGMITGCCRGIIPKAYGYKWRYV